MDIRPIRTEADHMAAVREIEALWGAAAGTAEGDRLDVLATLVEAYEAAHWPTGDLDPIEALQGLMDLNGYSRSDLAKVLNCGAGRASEIMSRKRALTLPMIRAVAKAWKAPADLLIGEYRLAA